jgi:uncharacterized protein YbaA (DUF1428 family)
MANQPESSMDCADGFVAAVPTRNKDAFVKHARVAVQVLQEAGATRVVACWGNDVASGQLTSFALVVQCQDDETVVFSSIVRPSRVVRDAEMDKMMNDPRMDPASNPMPFDGKRCVFGGFRVLPES